jgi:hypothetical protein
LPVLDDCVIAARRADLPFALLLAVPSARYPETRRRGSVRKGLEDRQRDVLGSKAISSGWLASMDLHGWIECGQPASLVVNVTVDSPILKPIN